MGERFYWKPILANSDGWHKNKTTNVLSFPFDQPPEVDFDLPLLGDIVACAKVIEVEAKQQNKILTDHWQHMIVHATLHLLGYDHVEENAAKKMEDIECAILKANPYEW